ncbi:L-asparaginase [Roseinatronobacter thiooxidans]|uniref:L-asparaginase n=3 Tax=Roseinatronobacter thiooxidans TaxID=121821 RepID=A0A2W7PN85_9RHOB|nr:L-asparaginase [Roseinatronobacter thiooxidans]
MMNDMTHKPRVTIIVLGGTITMVPQASGGISPSISGDELVAAVPQLESVANLTVVTPFLVPGASLTFAQMDTVTELIRDAGNTGDDGVVVVQGTDTIDETAFLIDLAGVAAAGNLAVVVTGAMRGAAAPGADGHANLLAAVTVAAAPQARGKGTLVVLNDEVHAACFVQKMDTGLPSAFVSPGVGPVGSVTEGQFRLRMLPHVPANSALRLINAAPVGMVATGLGDDGRLIDQMLDAGYEGAVIAAMGAGHVPVQIVSKLEKLSGLMPVVLSTRVPGGVVFTQSYGFPGSEIDLLRRGLIPSGILPPHKARLLLACLLGNTKSRDDIELQFRAFA